MRGNYIATDLRMAIVAARFNYFFGEALVEGAKDTFLHLGGEEKNLFISFVPGSFEIPLVTKKILESRQFDAVVCLGVLIKGETAHFDLIASNVTSSLQHLSLEYTRPVIFGILTVDTLEQAMNRSGAKSGNKGSEGMMAAIETVRLLEGMEQSFQSFKRIS